MKKLLKTMILFFSLGTVFAQEAPSDQIAEKLKDLISNLAETDYRHSIEIEEEAGVVKTDCSGLAVYLLQATSPEHYDLIELSDNPRARAKDFYRFFSSLDEDQSGSAGNDEEGSKLWDSVNHMEEIKPGDIIVYEFKDELKKAKGSTGHVMIAMSEAVKTESGDYAVRIADSTRKPHADDTRSEREEQDGLGMGVMWFVSDEQGRPVGYRWAKPDGNVRGADVKGILVARAN